MLGTEQVGNIVGQDVYGSDGTKIGSARQVHADHRIGQAEAALEEASPDGALQQ